MAANTNAISSSRQLAAGPPDSFTVAVGWQQDEKEAEEQEH